MASDMATTGSLSIEDFNDIALACQSVSYAWNELAKHLNIDVTTVMSIQKDKGGDGAIACLNKLLIVWLRRPSPNQPKPTWRKLCDAVANIDRPLSEKIWADHGHGQRSTGAHHGSSLTETTDYHMEQESGSVQTVDDVTGTHSEGVLSTDVHSLHQQIKSLESQLVNYKQMMMELDRTKDELEETKQNFKALQEELIDRNSRIKKEDLNEELLKTVDYGHVKRIEILVKSGANVNTTSKHWHRTPLHQASFNGRYEAVNVLISLGARVNMYDDTGDTPLLVASSRGQHEIATVLLSHGASVNQKNNVEWTPLHEASLSGHRDVVSVLLSHGATVNEKNDKGNTPLHCASMYDHTDVVESLLFHGAIVNSMNEDGQTPLHHKCLTMGRNRNTTPTAELLISHGADLYHEDKYRNSPVLLATVFGYEDLMLSHGVSEDIVSKYRLPRGWKANKDYDHWYIEYIDTQTGAKQSAHPSANISLSGLAGYIYNYLTTSFNRT